MSKSKQIPHRPTAVYTQFYAPETDSKEEKQIYTKSKSKLNHDTTKF